jgi:hypothetical protein
MRRSLEPTETGDEMNRLHRPTPDVDPNPDPPPDGDPRPDSPDGTPRPIGDPPNQTPPDYV